MHTCATEHRVGRLSRREGHPAPWLLVRWLFYPLWLIITVHRLGHRRKERTLENLAGADVELSQADLDEIAQIQATNPVHGDRYFGNDEAAKLWG